MSGDVVNSIEIGGPHRVRAWLVLIATLGLVLTGLGLASPRAAAAVPAVTAEQAARGQYGSTCGKTGYGTLCLQIRRTGSRAGNFRLSVGPHYPGTYRMAIFRSPKTIYKTNKVKFQDYHDHRYYAPWKKGVFLHPHECYFARMYKWTRQNGSPRPPYYWRYVGQTDRCIVFPDQWP